MRVRHTLLAALAVAAVTVPLAAAAAPTPIPGQGHVQNLGWLPTSTSIIGTTAMVSPTLAECTQTSGPSGRGTPA